MQAIRTPQSPIAAPSSKLRPENTTIVLRPRIMIASISGGPKSSATCAKNGATATSTTSDAIAATNAPSAEMASAGPARPLRAIW
jgi:hypothetical protein